MQRAYPVNKYFNFSMMLAGRKVFGHAMWEVSHLNVTELVEFVQRIFRL